MKHGDSSSKVLLVDDEIHALRSMELVLNAAGIDQIILCKDSREVETILEEETISVMVLDLWMPHRSGEDILGAIQADHPDIPVIVSTGANDIETAVRCMRAGAYDYMVKPVDHNRLVTSVRRALEMRELRRDYDMLTQRLLSNTLEHPEAFEPIVTDDPAMHKVFQYVETIAGTAKPVLVTGETGTGKELIARSIAQLSGRKGEFVAVNVAGVDDAVFSDTLFGHVRGAYTSADANRAGFIEKAAGGTLFLDEIGDLSLASQVKLLRLLETREYYPLGSDMARQTDARIIVATNQDLDALQRAGGFRADLYYRLKTHHVHLPPLRDRKDDIPLLVDHFLEKTAAALEKKRPTPPAELYVLLNTYHFPGNVRELEGMVFDAVSHHHSHKLSLRMFRDHVGQDPAETEDDNESVESDGDMPKIMFTERLPTVQEATDLLIQEAMRRTGGNQSLAAQLLGMARPTLNKRLRQLGS